MNATTLLLLHVVVSPTDPVPLARLESRYYIIHTNVPAHRAELIGTVMDATGKEYDRLFRGFAGVVRQKPEVKVFATKEQYVAEMERASFGGGNAEFTGGVFNPADGFVYTYDKRNLEQTLRHECFHQFVATVIGGRLPVWTNEGLAEYFEDGIFISRP